MLEHDGGLILERRTDSGLWGFVGGAVQRDESLSDAVAREVYEETGFRVVGLALFGLFSDPSRRIQYGDGSVVRVVTIAFRADAPDPQSLRPSHESSELRLFSRADLATLSIAATHRAILDHYLRGVANVAIE